LEILGSGRIGIDNGASASTVVCELSNQFVRLGHNVTVADVRTEKERTNLDARVKVVEVDIPSPIHPTQPAITGIWAWLARKVIPTKHYPYLSSMFGHYKFVRAVANNLAFDDFDIIHLHHGQQAIFVQKRYRKSYIYTGHWCYSADDRSLDARIEKMIINGARKAVGLGSYLKLFAPDADVQVIPNGIELHKWIPLDQMECREAIGESNDSFVVVFVGYIGAVKGVHILLEAIKNLYPEAKRLKAYIIGPTGQNADKESISHYSQTLMNDAKNLPIEFLGFLNNMSLEFRQYLSAADVFVLPSLNEALGLVVLEALAMGKPVIASDIGGLGEVIREDVGYVVKPGDVDNLTATIRYLYNNPKEVDRLKSNCRRFVEQNYTWSLIARRYIDLFKSCIA
jgi:glycosyltransferase involved in cell wall biosynthesis